RHTRSLRDWSSDVCSSDLWPNGKMPIRDDWKRLAETGFENFRLKVGGLVERPVELSLTDLEKLGETEHITMHHCIQGWSGIAKRSEERRVGKEGRSRWGRR